MTARDQQRADVLTRLIAGELDFARAVELLGLSERQLWRLKAGFLRDGPAALAHGNRGRASPRRLPVATRDRMPAEGLLLQLDGSRHDWLGDRGLGKPQRIEEALMIPAESWPCT